MVLPPPHIAQWLSKRYPRPKVDPEWLQGCYEWLISQPGADPTSQKFLEDVEAQLLQSDLRDSMLEGTGLPIHMTQSDNQEANTRLAGSPVLVEIAAITEIASSAYQLEQIRNAREERMRAGQLEDENDEREGDLEVEGEGPIPKYPRGMLRFELSDGSTTLNAIEYRSIPELTLGKTPLGYKMLLKNPMMRHGIAFLDPSTIVLKGYRTEDRETLQPYDFARGLRVRMGLPIDHPNVNPAPTQPAVAARSPLREISPPPEPPLHPDYNDDANLEPRRRKLPASNAAISIQGSTTSSITLVSSCDTNTSPYFSHPATSSTVPTGMHGLDFGPTPAQASQAPMREPDDDGSEDLFGQFDSIDFFDGTEIDENAPPPRASGSKPATLALNSTPSLPGSSLETLSSSRPIDTGHSNNRSLADSIEFVSVTPSQSIGRNQQSGKGKERERLLSTPPPAATFISSNSVELDTDILDVLGEVDSDPEDFLRRQTEEMDRIAQSRTQNDHASSHFSSLGVSATTQPTSSKGKGKRPIAPLPRYSLSTQSQRKPSAAIDVETIDILSSSSSSSSLQNVDLDMEIEDEEEDKENMPVMTRHVRRKVASGTGGSSNSPAATTEGKKPFISGEIIDLSDED